MLGFSSGAALALQAAASGVKRRKLASDEAPYVGIRIKRGTKPDHLAEPQARLDKGDRGGAVGYFMVDMVGAPARTRRVLRMSTIDEVN